MSGGVDLEHAIESWLTQLAPRARTAPRLRAALWAAVFPGGARLRPRLTLAVHAACGGRGEQAALAMATAVEFLHCASLVHDDLPCFDDAELRRGLPSIHRAFGEATAVLAGDALIVAAMRLPAARAIAPELAGPLLAVLGEAAGPAGGLTGGQAWELEAQVDVAAYHAQKTGALFVAAAQLGAIVAGTDARAWTRFGASVGEAYQVADDLHDALSTSRSVGKPVGRDVALDRPSAVRELGLEGAFARLRTLVGEALAAVPSGVDRSALEPWLRLVSERLTPSGPRPAAAATPEKPTAREDEAGEQDSEWLASAV